MNCCIYLKSFSFLFKFQLSDIIKLKTPIIQFGTSRFLQAHIDLFIHDSDHSYETMKLECELIQKYHSDAVIVIDDYYANNYAFDFQKETGRNLFEIDDINDDLQSCQGCALLNPK